MTQIGFVNLFEAVMEQAYKDANIEVKNEKDAKLKKEAQEYIDTMKKLYA